MVTLEWCLERMEGVTLVGLVVAAERSCRVQIENRLDGPVWPPRRHGNPADGWDDGSFTGCVPADGRLTVGYATPASPSEPPAAVVSTEPVSDGADVSGTDSVDAANRADRVPTVEQSPAGVVRALGDPLVPRDSVPVPEATGSQPAKGQPRSEPTAHDDADTRTNDIESATDRAGRSVESPRRVEGDRNSTPDPERFVPGPVRHWLDAVECRVDCLEGRPGGSNLDGEARERDTTEPASPVAAAREVDRFALRQVRRRIDSLLARTGGGQHCHECGSELPDRREDAVGPGKG